MCVVDKHPGFIGTIICHVRTVAIALNIEMNIENNTTFD